MGEPFRAAKDGENPIDTWFNRADANHDGALTLAEFTLDGDRFFLMLDRDHDGEIDPNDIDYYETELLPEIRVGTGFGGDGAAYQPAASHPRYGSVGVGGGHGAGGGPISDSGEPGLGSGSGSGSGSGLGAGQAQGQEGESTPPPPRAPRYDSVKRGAARYGFFDFPEPVSIADRNFNRGVSALEFRDAARTRFNALDANHDGKILRAELPDIEPPVVGHRRRGRADR